MFTFTNMINVLTFFHISKGTTMQFVFIFSLVLMLYKNLRFVTSHLTISSCCLFCFLRNLFSSTCTVQYGQNQSMHLCKFSVLFCLASRIQMSSHGTLRSNLIKDFLKGVRGEKRWRFTNTSFTKETSVHFPVKK